MNVYPRTTCDCPACVDCCKRQPGPLIPGDAEKIAAYLGVSIDALREKLWASPGSLVANRASGQSFRVGTITPRLVDGRCVFLDERDRCRIHPVAPFGCAFFDVHMDAETAYPRSVYMVMASTEPEYQKFRSTLVSATSWRPVDFKKENER